MNDILLTPLPLNELESLIQNSVRKVLKENHFSDCKNNTEADELLTVQGAAKFLSLTAPTIYNLVQRKTIPACKRGKRLYFSKKKLTEWVLAGRKKTISEIEAEADQFLSKNKR